MKRLGKSPGTVTIREVAQQAGVSVATASYALSGQGRISAETKARVRQAAEALGYSPSLAAQALKGAKGNMIVIMTDGFAGPWYGEILEALQPPLKEAGYTVLAITIQKESLSLCQNLANAGLVRGMVILNPGTSWLEWMRPLTETVPTALFDGDESLGQTMRFVLDNRVGIEHLMEHLWDQGHRDYLWLDGNLEGAWDAQERREAFDGFLDSRGVPEAQRARAQGGFQREASYQAVTQILKAGRRPGAIVAANDESAIGALKAVRDQGLTVPGEVAVAGFDGIDASAWTEPALTTLRFDRRALGHGMASWLIETLAGGPGTPGVQTIPVELVVRGSTFPRKE